MNNILKGFSLVAVVLTLAACGTTVTEVSEATAELEVQIISTTPDYQPVTYMEVADSNGVVAFRSDFLNRVQKFELEAGETYSIFARVDMSNLTEEGHMTISREVTLVSQEQKVVLDLRQVLKTEISYTSLDAPLELFSRFETEVSNKSGVPPLEFVGGKFTGRGLFSISELEFVSLSGANLEIGSDAVGRQIVTFTFEKDTTDNPFATISTVFSTIFFENRDYCDTSLGVFEFEWENEFSHMTQTLTPIKRCKG